MTCPTNKDTYTLKEAKKVAKEIRKNGGRVVAPYRCGLCKGWHVGIMIESPRDVLQAKKRRGI